METAWGREYGYGEIIKKKNFSETYQLFKKQVPLSTYDDIHPWINKIIQGEKNILWPGETKWFAKSSGTTSDKSKFIPVTAESLETCHYQAGKDLVALYLEKIIPSPIFVWAKLSVLAAPIVPDEENNNIYKIW